MSTTARHLRVTGRVQGVFFRASLRDRARRAGVAGWVRNCPDGAVEAHLEGPDAAVGTIESWVRSGGPPDAVIDAVEAEDVAPTGAREFQVAR